MESYVSPCTLAGCALIWADRWWVQMCLSFKWKYIRSVIFNNIFIYFIQAPLSAEESISSVLPVISGLTEKNHGGFVDYSGDNVPWWSPQCVPHCSSAKPRWPPMRPETRKTAGGINYSWIPCIHLCLNISVCMWVFGYNYIYRYIGLFIYL